MQRFTRSKLAVITIAALAILALAGGTATAAKLITGKQIKNGSIGVSDLSRSARKALKGGTGPRGPQGPAGPSLVGQLNTFKSAEVAFGPSDVAQFAIAYCPPGQRVVSGGGVSISDEEIAASIPTDARDGWAVIGVDLIDSGGEYVQAYALCAPSGAAVAASASSHAKDIDAIAKLVAKFTGTRH